MKAVIDARIWPGGRKPQAGATLLGVIAVSGAVLVMIQAGLYYRARGGARVIAMEKAKIMSMQMAEAGVEENIADIGTRRLRVREGLDDTVTYAGHSLGAGNFTSRLTTVAVGAEADTVDLASIGSVGQASQTVRARLRLKKYVDTMLTPIMVVSAETSYTYPVHTVYDTAFTTTVQDPNTMPPVDQTAAYSACMASSAKKCDVCHLPGGNPSNGHVINISKSAIHTHISHHGDYVTTDGTCDIYEPRTVRTITSHTEIDTVMHVVDHTTYDTTVAVDTAVKVQILSWR